MTVFALVSDHRPTFHDSNGDPLSGGQLFVYVAGSSTKATSYADSDGAIANSNPIVLNSRGETASGVYVATGTYKLVLAPADDTDPPASAIWTRDNLTPINDTSTTVDEWVASGLTPTYLNAAQFSVPGDNTSEFHVGRRVKVSVSAGTKYGVITASAFSSVTTVTVSLDSGSLDAGLSAVSYGLLSASSPSVPGPRNNFAATTTPAVTDDLDGGYQPGSLWVDTTNDLAYVCVDKTNGAAVWERINSRPVIGTPVTLSGTSVDLKAADGTTTIPSWVTQIEICFSGLSTSGTNVLFLRLGDSGGLETTGYLGAAENNSAVGVTNLSGSFILTNSIAAAGVYHGTCTLTLMDRATNLWVAKGLLMRSDSTNIGQTMAGTKALSATLTTLTLSTSGGTDTFDAGTVNIVYS